MRGKNRNVNLIGESWRIICCRVFEKQSVINRNIVNWAFGCNRFFIGSSKGLFNKRMRLLLISPIIKNNKKKG